MQCSCSSWLSVGVSPVVPTATRPWLPSSTCQFHQLDQRLLVHRAVGERGDQRGNGASEHARLRTAGRGLENRREPSREKPAPQARECRTRRTRYGIVGRKSERSEDRACASIRSPPPAVSLAALARLARRRRGRRPPPRASCSPRRSTATRAGDWDARRAPSPGRPAARSPPTSSLWVRLRDGAGDLVGVRAVPRRATPTGRGWRRCAAPASG